MISTRQHVVATCAALLATLSWGTPGAGDDGKRAQGITYVSLVEAVASARKDYRPLVVYFDGGAGYERVPKDVPTRWEGATSGARFRRLARSVAICRLSGDDLRAGYPPEPTEKKADKPKKKPPDAGKRDPAKRRPLNKRAAEPKKKPAKSAGERLGLVAGVPAVLLIDFRERVVRRFVTEFPRKTAFQRSLRGFVKRNAVLAKYALQAEEVLERANYSYELGKRRIAVQQVLPLEDPQEKKKMDPVLKDKVEKVLTRYRGDAEKLVKKGFTLDKQKKYADALKVLEDVAREFPFPDVLKKVHQKRGEILRKAQLGI